MTAPFEHINQGRNTRTMVVLILIYAALLAAIILVDAAWWLMAVLALFTVPALWDVWTNRAAGVSLDDETLGWFSGRRRADIALVDIDHMRFDRRLDFSVRVSAVLHSKQKIRLPYEAQPPHQVFQDAFEARGVRTERHQFSLL